MTEESYYIGIDPGEKGALALLSPDEDRIWTAELSQARPDWPIITAIVQLLKRAHDHSGGGEEAPPLVIALEKIPLIAPSAHTLKLHQSYGACREAMLWADYHFSNVTAFELTPQKWKRLLKLRSTNKYAENKKEAVEFIAAKYPEVSEDAADAACIAIAAKINHITRTKK